MSPNKWKAERVTETFETIDSLTKLKINKLLSQPLFKENFRCWFILG